MSKVFREFLKKVGSGNHTGEDLSREEAAIATRMMLLQEATPAQIGAFMIAHRIKRPTAPELAGMLDAYEQLGPQLQPLPSSRQVLVLNSPYDGRSRTAPISPLTALILAAAGCAVIQHGGDRMPTKEGTPLIEIWQHLGVDWTNLDLVEVQQVLATTGIGFVYLPRHFPLAAAIVPYREQIGKRPPFATIELMWCPYAGPAHLFCGFVHPPTEVLFQSAFALRGCDSFTTVKGLEGSCDLPRERTAIIGLGADGTRLHLSPLDYGFAGKNVPLEASEQIGAAMQAVLRGEVGEWMRSTLWNAGFYLWRSGISPEITAGFVDAVRLLSQGLVLEKLQQLQRALGAHQLVSQS